MQSQKVIGLEIIIECDEMSGDATRCNKTLEDMIRHNKMLRDVIQHNKTHQNVQEGVGSHKIKGYD